MSINNPYVCATKLHSVYMPLLRVICQCHQVSGVKISYTLCKIALWCQWRIQTAGGVGGLHTLYKICRILPQKIFKKALYICEPPPPFSTFRICKQRVCFLMLFFACLFICQEICVIHAPSENIQDAHLIIFYPIQTILQLIRSFRRKNRLVKHSRPLDEDEGMGPILF